MKNEAKLIIIWGLLLFAVPEAFAQEAVIRELTGTVEIKKPGSAVWENAMQGQTVPVDTIISTGFKSYAVISMGNSSLSVRPLTRFSLTELISSQAAETINVSLQAGRVRADVKPPSGTRSTFSVQTPPVTASVRGTIFEMDIYNLWVIEGSVEFRSASGTLAVVDSGGYNYVDERTGRVDFAKNTLLRSLDPDQPIAFDSFSSFQGAATRQNREIEVTGGLDFD